MLTVLGIDKDGFGKVLFIKPFEGVSYVDQVSYVSFLHTTWRFKRIFVDASSHAVVDSLRAHHLPVQPISFSLQGKMELYSRLKAAIFH